MNTGRPRGKKTTVTSHDVLHTIIYLYQSNPPREATRKTIAHELGAGYHLIDEHVDKLLSKGQIRRVIQGVFAPVDVHPDKVVSSTFVPGGRIKLDIDDVCLDLSIRDVRAIVGVLAGFSVVQIDVSSIQNGG